MSGIERTPFFNREGEGGFSITGKFRGPQKHNKEPGPVKVYTKDEIEEYKRKNNISTGKGASWTAEINGKTMMG